MLPLPPVQGHDNQGYDNRDRGARRACWWWAGGLTGCAALLLVLAVAGGGRAPLRSADRWVADRLHRSALAHPVVTRTNRILTDWVWDPVTMRLLALAAVVFLVRHRAWTLVRWVAVTSAAGLAVQSGVKAAAGRARPHLAHPVDSAHGWAFPSGHAMTATVTCGLLLGLFLLLGREGEGTGGRVRWQSAAAWTAAAVSVAGAGFTRVYLGVHWWTDVVGGWLLGGTVLAGCSAWLAPWRNPGMPGSDR